jgi:hypothetical protein
MIAAFDFFIKKIVVCADISVKLRFYRNLIVTSGSY